MLFRFYHPNGKQGYDEDREERTFRLRRPSGEVGRAEMSPGPPPPAECFVNPCTFVLHDPKKNVWWAAQDGGTYLWSDTHDLSEFFHRVYPDEFDEVFL